MQEAQGRALPSVSMPSGEGESGPAQGSQTSTSEPNSPEKGYRYLSSVIGNMWHSEESADKPAEPSETSTQTVHSAASSKDKAINTIGEGQASLKDFDDDTAKDTKAPESGKERTLAREVPGLEFASSKRNADFHRIFHSVPESEPLVEDHSCALSRDILLQGRLYITPHHVCFHSNILGWTTHLVFSFKEIVSIQLKNTLGIFPNGIYIQTLHARYSLASFINRDHVADLLKKIWKSRLNSRGKGSKDADTQSEDEDSLVDNADSITDSDIDTTEEYSDSEGSDLEGNDTSNSERAERGDKSEKSDKKGDGKFAVENIGPDSGKPVTLPKLDPKEKVLATETVDAPLGVCVNLVYGDNTEWYRKFLVDTEKNKDLSDVPAFKEDDGKKTRRFEYIKPLSGPVGPKQTKCICTETAEKWDLKESVVVITATQTPDVPSGNVFTTMTRTTMAWGDNTTQVQMSTWIDWTGKSWFKSAIEKGAFDGQSSYCKHFVADMESTLVKAGSKQVRVRPTRQENKQETEKGDSPATKTTNVPLVLAVVAVSLAAVLLLAWVLSRLRAPGTDQAKFAEQEYQLWQWIDSRTYDDPVTYQQMSDADLEEVIRITERRLEKLKALSSS